MRFYEAEKVIRLHQLKYWKVIFAVVDTEFIVEVFIEIFLVSFKSLANDFFYRNFTG